VRLRRRGGNHRSLESGKHARINILAITVITDWQDSRPHTRLIEILQSTTTPPAQRIKLMSYRFSGGLSS
jgi:hypothetical protein